LALCGRLIKGYGETNHRGRDNLLHVIRHVANDQRTTAAARATAIRRAREAALTDEAGIQLDRVLKDLGAPARPIKAQPIRWMPRSRNT
jgi:indolepyruvate ferredoxin oxidoreductase beta subunit